MDPLAGLAADTRSLDRLKNEAAKDPASAVRAAAGQFESLFMQMVLKSMREAMPKSGMLESSGQSMYTGMLDQQLSQTMSGRVGGLADVIARQLSRNIKGGELPAVSVPARPTTSLQGATIDSLSPGRLLPSKTMPDLKGLSSVQGQFVKQLWPHAQAAQQSTGVPAAFVIGQAALESGWGRQEIRMPDGSRSHNLFGIKAGSQWKGATVDVTTTEYIGGRPQRVIEKFRAYGSYAEAFKDWSTLMGNNERFGQVLKASGDVESYAAGMQRAGYATDPRYGDKLERTINQTLALKRLVI